MNFHHSRTITVIVGLICGLLGASTTLASAQTTTMPKAYLATIITYVSPTSEKQIYSALQPGALAMGQNAGMSLVNYVMPLATVRGSQYFSLSNIQSNAALIRAAGGSIVGYDFESCCTPTSELANPLSSFQQAYNIARANGLMLMCSPTMNIALQYAPLIAKYCAIFNGQGERGEEAFADHYISNYKTLSSEVRRANPFSKIIAEVSTTAPYATLSVMEYDFSQVAPYVDGTTCWYSSSTLSSLESYIKWFNYHY